MSDLNNLSDEQLLKQYRKGCQLSFTAIFNRYERILIRYTASMTESYEEVVQDTFLRLINKPPKFLLNQSVKSWLFRVAYNLCLSSKRRSQKEMVAIEELELHHGSEAKSPIEHILKDENNEAIKELIDNLPLKYKEVITLHVFAELPFREVARITKTPLGTSLARMQKALAILRIELLKESVN